MKSEKFKFLERKDYIHLLATASKESERDYILLLLMGELGLRVSEAIHLRFSDVKDDGDYLIFSIGTLKQKGDKRPIQDVVLGKLPSATVRQYLSTKQRRKTDRIFPITRVSAFRMFKKYAKLAGLSKEFSTHSLRHYQGHRVFEQTGSVDEVAKRLRHTKSATAYIYSHLSLKKQKEIADGRKQ